MMNRRFDSTCSALRALACGLAPLLLVACGGGGGSTSTGGGSGNGGSGGYGAPPPPGSSAYVAKALVSNGIATAKTTDAALANPWGISFAPGNLVWTANNASQTSTLYDGNGVKDTLTVTLPPGSNGPANPTGIVFNPGSAFLVSNGVNSAPAQFIFAGEAGTLVSWSQAVDMQHALTSYDDGAAGAVYKGLTLATDSGGATHVYAADFHNNKIDEFDATFKKVTLSTAAFFDPQLPSGYAPFNIQAVTVSGTTSLYVTYAKTQGPDNRDPVLGAGLGLMDVFDTQGNFKSHLVPTGGKLNAPWGVALAPAGFGTFSNTLLVGNFGDGWINAYDPVSGAFKGTLADTNGLPIVNPGLWGIAFGNAADSQPATTLFFAAGPNNEADGIYGRIDLMM